MDKLTNEMANKIVDVLYDDNAWKNGAKIKLRSAGLLEPEETALEKARNAWRVATSDVSRRGVEAVTIMHDAYEQAVADEKAARSSDVAERDKKLAQSMTVEEYNEWYMDWVSTAKPATLELALRLKIKERNEKARKDGE